MQIYQDMNIGTAKVTKEETQGIKHYMIDIVSPSVRYSVANYKKQAEECIRKIIEQGKIPIIVGGTGLYINSLIYGIEFQNQEIDETYRHELEKKDLIELYTKASEIDPEAMKKISANDRKRIIRVLEIYHETGKTKTQQDEESRKEVEFDYKVFAINIDRQKLYQRINYRVDFMIEQGLIEEVQYLLHNYKDFPTAMQGLGYKEVVEYLENKTTKEEMIEKIKVETRRYAKRQLTWFRKNKEVIWLDGEKGIESNVQYIIDKVL